MSEDENKDALENQLCTWCNKLVPSGKIGEVCQDCQNTLRHAGVSTEEIFGKKDSSPAF